MLDELNQSFPVFRRFSVPLVGIATPSRRQLHFFYRCTFDAGLVPPELGDLGDLETLNLSCNKLQGEFTLSSLPSSIRCGRHGRTREWVVIVYSLRYVRTFRGFQRKVLLL